LHDISKCYDALGKAWTKLGFRRRKYEQFAQTALTQFVPTPLPLAEPPFGRRRRDPTFYMMLPVLIKLGHVDEMIRRLDAGETTVSDFKIKKHLDILPQDVKDSLESLEDDHKDMFVVILRDAYCTTT
jgi:hypothetical protein